MQQFRKATPEVTRTHNTQLVLRTIYEGGCVSRAEVARLTGLARPTVSDVVSDLIHQGLVQELGYAPSTGGKRPLLLQVAEDSNYVVGINLARESFSGALINLRGEIRHRVDLPLEGRDGDVALELVYALVETLVKAATRPLLGIGVGAPGMVDSANGVLRQAVNLSWRDVPLRRLLEERFHLPVYVANDCHVAALAEHTFGQQLEDGLDLVVINVGWGVGSGIVHEGRLMHGRTIGAGEIGHVVIVDGGERCQCGNFGCLETLVSTRAIVKRAQELASTCPDSVLHQFAAHPGTITIDTVCWALQTGDPETQRLVAQVGRYLGIAAASMVGTLGSCRILIAGRIICFGQYLLEAMRAEMSRRCLPWLARETEVGFVSLGSDIVLLGASALLLHNELGLINTVCDD